MSLGDQLKKSRINKGYSQGDVAKQLNISRQSISKWENSNSYPDLDNLVKLSTYYDISIDDLLKKNQELKNKEEKNEVYLKKTVQKLKLIRENTGKDEGLILLILAFIGCLIAPFGFFISLIVIRRNKTTNTLYKTVYFSCACCLLVNLFVTYSLVTDTLGWGGTTTIEYIDE